MTEGTPISYEAVSRGTPVLSSSGTQIGTLEHVLAVSDLDIFEGIVITACDSSTPSTSPRSPQLTSGAISTTRKQLS